MAIDNISDTARWVAVYRAMETSRPDAVFRDPFAERLAGERGHQIPEEMPFRRALALPMILRTAVVRQIILGAVDTGAEPVRKVAPGLEPRPARRQLPPPPRPEDV